MKEHYNKIRDITVKKNDKKHFVDKDVDKLRVVFGPHFFFELTEENGELFMILGATHHGFKIKANEVNGLLDRLIQDVRAEVPDRMLVD